MVNLRRKIDECIDEKYKSRSEPDYSFVALAVSNNLYHEIYEKLTERGLTVKDITDVNDDVAFVLELGSIHGIISYLRLSMVGPFAMSYDSETRNNLSQNGLRKFDDLKKTVSNVLESANFYILDKSLLMSRVQLDINNDGNSDVTVFAALFSTSEELPL